MVVEKPRRLVMELGGLQSGSQADKVDVTGALNLGGKLSVVLYNGFTPLLGERWDLFDASVIIRHGYVHNVAAIIIRRERKPRPAPARVRLAILGHAPDIPKRISRPRIGNAAPQ